MWMLPTGGDRKPSEILPGRSRYGDARLSPDGRWLAYVSDEAGREDVYIQTFPAGKGKWMISNQGGSRPEWQRDGRELYYLQSRHLMATEIRMGSALEASAPRALMEMPDSKAYAVSPDGRFLVSAPLREGPPEPIQVILNWTAELQP
jgi:Tol biopolymer transport system component